MSARETTSARTELEKERLKRQAKSTTSDLTPLKIYLLAYNILSALAWTYLLFLTVSFLLTPRSPLASTKGKADNILTRLFPSSASPSALPQPLQRAVAHLRGSYGYKDLGWWTKWVQTGAVLEVVHSALGLVRSPVGTTAAQVFSRLWTVWGVVEVEPSTHSNPLFTTMLLAWSITEIIRYSFYATSILGLDLPVLNWLRYTTFLPLYPLGASSEAFISFSTLPPLSTLPLLSPLKPLGTLITSLPDPLRRAILRTELGRALLWNLAKSSAAAKGAATRAWGAMDFARLVQFVTWWPALYVLYTHMLKLRKRHFARASTLGKKTQ